MASLPPLEPQNPGGYPAPLNYARPMPPRTDLREIASRQKAIQFCILGYIACAILVYALPRPINGFAALGVIASAVAGAVFVFLLALSLYSTGVGVVLGICMFIPLIGLIILLIVNGKATNVLREDGIHVGLLGARMSDIPPG